MLSDSAILKHVAKQPKRTAGFKQLVRELGLRGDERRELDARLKKLVSSGALLAVDSDRYALPQVGADKNLVVGRLTMHRDGFGFVIPDPSSLPPRLKSLLAGDIFIAPHLIGNAMHGDRVLVDVVNVRTDGRAEGRIVRPVTRAHPTVVGLFRYGQRGNVVLPYDTRIQHQVEIPPGDELTPALREEFGVGQAKDAGRARRIGRIEELDGAVVNVELLRFPKGGVAPVGRVIEILGKPGDLGVDTEIIIRKHHLPHEFAANVLSEAERRAGPVLAADLEGRTMRSNLCLISGGLGWAAA